MIASIAPQCSVLDSTAKGQMQRMMNFPKLTKSSKGSSGEAVVLSSSLRGVKIASRLIDLLKK